MMPTLTAATSLRIGIVLMVPCFNEFAAGESKCDVCSGDRSAARTAVGLNDVAIEIDLAFAEQLGIDDRPQAAADQTLDFLRPARRPLRLTLRAGVRRTRQHRVLGGHPAEAFVSHEHRHAVLDRCGADDLRSADLDQCRPFGVRRNIRCYLDVADLIVRAVILSRVCH